MFYRRKALSEKVATIKRFEYLPLSSELKNQTGIAKDQYKSFKDQINVINYNREEYDAKAENGEIIDNVHHRHIGDECQNLIGSIFKFGLID